MKTEYAPFDASSHLDNEEVIAEYLSAAAEDKNPDVLLLALADVAKARGMAHVAKAAGLSRESLYKTLTPGSHPRFETIRAILRALNVEIAVRPPLTDKSGDVRERFAAELEQASRLAAEFAAIAERTPLTDKERDFLAAWEEIKKATKERAKPEPTAKPAVSKRRA